MNTTHIRRTTQAALTTSKPLRYATLSGRVLADLTAGRLIRVTTYLTRLGLDDAFTARYGSPAGRAIAKAHRQIHHAEPLRCWIQNDAGRFIHVMVYRPAEPALMVGAAAYKRTAHLVDRAAYTEAA